MVISSANIEQLPEERSLRVDVIKYSGEDTHPCGAPELRLKGRGGLMDLWNDGVKF